MACGCGGGKVQSPAVARAAAAELKGKFDLHGLFAGQDVYYGKLDIDGKPLNNGHEGALALATDVDTRTGQLRRDVLNRCIEGAGDCGYAYVQANGDVWRNHTKIGNISQLVRL